MSMEIKENNVVGFAGLITQMASFNKEIGENAGSRQTANGDFFATPYKFKWLIRDFWANQLGNKSVLVKDSKELTKDGKIGSRTLDKRLEYVFDGVNFSKINQYDLLKLALTKKDVKNFGVVLPVKNQTVSLTGVSQITTGMNIYKDTEELEFQINSSYSTKDDNTQTTFGRNKILDFANYIYNFTVMPSMLNKNTLGYDVEQYTDNDYNWLKKGILRSPQANKSNSTGTFTGYAMFAEIKKGEDLIQHNFQDYISCQFDYDSEKYVIDFTKLVEYLDFNKDMIESIEFYKVNNIKLEFKGLDSLENLELPISIKDMSESRLIEID